MHAHSRHVGEPYCYLVRVALVDPPAYTPPYDRALAAALTRAGADVELITSRFRYGGVPEPAGYAVRELFYPVSSRIGRTRLRQAVKTLEHPLGLAQLGVARSDIVHLQWSTLPELDRWLLHTRAPLVLTAHDLLPRRTAHRTRLWRALFDRFERVVVHSESGRDALAAFGVDPAKLRVIPHPVFRGPLERQDDGRTALVLGLIRPYKGLSDSIEAVRRVEGARLVVAGDARESLDGYRAAAGGFATWRLGWLAPGDIADVLAESTVALFPYRPEIDQSGALLQALGSGVPAVVYDVGGLAEPIRRFGAGRVVAAGDLDAFTAALRELLDDPVALAAARVGAEQARAELTWDASAAAHLALYDELT
jgi:glycosyltransferase involved in cell wall biosynthesis